MVPRERVVEVARSYILTPWHHQARIKGPKGGVDCAGLIICVARELGLLGDYVDAANYSRYADGTLKPLCDRYMHSVPFNEARPGDVLLIAFEAEPHHLGFMAYLASQATVIHSYAEARCVVENAIEPVWRRLIRGAYSIPGVG